MTLRGRRLLVALTCSVLPFVVAWVHFHWDLDRTTFAYLASNGVALVGLWFFLLASLSGDKGTGSYHELLLGFARDAVGTVRKWTTEGLDQPWSIGEAIGIALRSFWRRPGTAFVVAVFFALNVGLAGASAYGLTLGALRVFPPSTPPLSGLGAPMGMSLGRGNLLAEVEASLHWQIYVIVAIAAILGLLVWSVGNAYLLESALAVVRDEKAAPGRLGRAVRRAPKIFVLQILTIVLSAGPALLWLVMAVPEVTGFFLVSLALVALGAALVAGTRLVFAPFFVVDEDASIGRSLVRSWRVTGDYWVGIYILALALFPVTLLGLGSSVLFPFAITFSTFALAFTYVRATGRNDLPWLEPDFATKSIRLYLGVTFGVLLLLFVGFSAWVATLPTMRGSAWSIRDTIIRASAILTGVGCVIVALAFVLPFLLDALEGKAPKRGFWAIAGTIAQVAMVLGGVIWFGVGKNPFGIVLVFFALLPLLLKRVARNAFAAFVAARHVRSPKSGFLTVISILSICGVAMSSCSLSSVVSVMGGFSADLKRKILGNNAHIVVDQTAGTPFAGYEETLQRVRNVPGVTGAAAVMHGEVMASSNSNIAGVMVSGVEPKDIVQVNELSTTIEVGKLEYLEHPEKLTRLPPNEPIGIGPGGEQYFKQSDLPPLADDIDESVRKVILDKPDRPGIVLGKELAKTLHVYVGDEITLVSPLGDLGPMGVLPRTKKFRVAAIFYSGMYEYDATYVYTMLDVAQDYFQAGDKVSTIEIKVEDAERVELVTPLVTEAIARDDLRVRNWREINKSLFSALTLERYATFVILLIAILVASFCIVCTLLLMVTEKGKEIAILKAVGASDRAILVIFMIEGIIIGGIGTVFGVATGLSVCAGLKWFGLRLDPEVYYIDKLPITVNPWDFFAVAVAALTICTLSTIYPAYAASRLRPVDGLRYE